MVSLSNESRRSGGYFFNDTSIQPRDEEELLTPDSVPLSSEFDPPFRGIPTFYTIILQLIVVVSLEVCVIFLPIKCTGPPDNSCGADAKSIIVYTHGALWFVHLAFDRYYRHHHYISRQNGYLEFYRRTRHIRRIAFNINSGANAVVLILLRILDDTCPHIDKCAALDKATYLQIVISIEVVATLPFLVFYLVKTKRFNDSRASPDVAQDEMLTSFLHSSTSSEIGYKDDQYTDQVLEKQADMIRYLKHHNSQLAKRIMALSAENNALKSSSH